MLAHRERERIICKQMKMKMNVSTHNYGNALLFLDFY